MGKNRMIEARQRDALFFFERDGSLWKFHQMRFANGAIITGDTAHKINKKYSMMQNEVLTW